MYATNVSQAKSIYVEHT